MLTSLGLAVIAFASTNIDDVFVLVGFFSDAAYHSRDIVLGQFLGMGVLVTVSLACALFALSISGAYLGLLGLVPIAIGLKKLWELRRTPCSDIASEEIPAARTSLTQVLAVASVTAANGGDNIGVYVPMFATSSKQDLAFTIAVFAVMTALWCAVARFLIRHPTFGAPFRRWGHRALPFVLLALGGWILWDTGLASPDSLIRAKFF